MDTVFLALRVVVSLAVVIGAIWFVQKRLGRAAKVSSKSKPIAMIARQSIGVKASVAVVEFGGKRFLLGVTEHGISVLDSAQIEAAAALEAAQVQAAQIQTAESSEETVARASDAPLSTSGRHFADALSRVEGDQPDVPNTYRRNRGSARSPVAGSILSASTWRQAFTALRVGR